MCTDDGCCPLGWAARLRATGVFARRAATTSHTMSPTIASRTSSGIFSPYRVNSNLSRFRCVFATGRPVDKL
jgi:hypothetical protein